MSTSENLSPDNSLICTNEKEFFAPWFKKGCNPKEQTILQNRKTVIERILAIINQSKSSPITIESAMADPAVQQDMLAVFSKISDMPEETKLAVEQLAQKIIEKTTVLRDSTAQIPLYSIVGVKNNRDRIETILEVLVRFNQIPSSETPNQKISLAQEIQYYSSDQPSCDGWYSPKKVATKLYKNTVMENFESALNDCDGLEDVCSLGRKALSALLDKKNKNREMFLEKLQSSSQKHVQAALDEMQKSSTPCKKIEMAWDIWSFVRYLPSKILRHWFPNLKSDIETIIVEVFPEAKNEIQSMADFAKRVTQAKTLRNIGLEIPALKDGMDDFIKNIAQQSMNENAESFVDAEPLNFLKKRKNICFQEPFSRAQEKALQELLEGKGEQKNIQEIAIMFVELQKLFSAAKIVLQLSVGPGSSFSNHQQVLKIFLQEYSQRFQGVASDIARLRNGEAGIELLKEFFKICSNCDCILYAYGIGKCADFTFVIPLLDNLVKEALRETEGENGLLQLEKILASVKKIERYIGLSLENSLQKIKEKYREVLPLSIKNVENSTALEKIRPLIQFVPHSMIVPNDNDVQEIQASFFNETLTNILQNDWPNMSPMEKITFKNQLSEMLGSNENFLHFHQDYQQAISALQEEIAFI